MDTSAKGSRRERIAAKQLQEQGWTIVFRARRSRAGGGDYADLFDILAVRNHPNHPEQSIEKIHVSCKHAGSVPGQHIKDIDAYKRAYGLSGELFQLWVWYSPRYAGRGKNKKWTSAHWKVHEI